MPIALIIIQSCIRKGFWTLNNLRSFTKTVSGLTLCFFQCSCADSAGGAALLTISLMTIACVAMFKSKVNANRNTNATVWQQWVIVLSEMPMAVRRSSNLTSLFGSLAPLPWSFSRTRHVIHDCSHLEVLASTDSLSECGNKSFANCELSVYCNVSSWHE